MRRKQLRDKDKQKSCRVKSEKKKQARHINQMCGELKFLWRECWCQRWIEDHCPISRLLLCDLHAPSNQQVCKLNFMPCIHIFIFLPGELLCPLLSWRLLPPRAPSHSRRGSMCQPQHKSQLWPNLDRQHFIPSLAWGETTVVAHRNTATLHQLLWKWTQCHSRRQLMRQVKHLFYTRLVCRQGWTDTQIMYNKKKTFKTKKLKFLLHCQNCLQKRFVLAKSCGCASRNEYKTRNRKLDQIVTLLLFWTQQHSGAMTSG